MKLLNCVACHDVVKLQKRIRKCACGKSKGKYVDDLYATYSGPARILGFNNFEYVRTLKIKPTLDRFGMSAVRGEWFVIVEGCHITKLD